MESEKKTSGGDKYSKLAGNTIIFAISSFSSKLLTLLVQPFLTYAMAEIADLGLAKILSQYANLLIPFVSMGMSNAIIRFGLDKGNSEKQVFTNGLLTILGGRVMPGRPQKECEAGTRNLVHLYERALAEAPQELVKLDEVLHGNGTLSPRFDHNFD